MNKKTLITGLAAILIALVTLSGCDAILEAFYPELVEKGGEGNNAIGLWVEISVPGGEVNDPQIAAIVEDAWTGEIIRQEFVWPSWNWDSQGNLILSAYIELYGIPGSESEYHEYRVFAWLERYGNTYPEWDEPQTNAFWNPYPNDPEWKETIFWFPNDYGTWIEASAFVGFGEAPVNYQFYTDGAFVIDLPDISGTKEYFVFPEDPNLTMSEVSWNLYDAGYGWMDGAWQSVPSAASTTFSVDYSSYTTGGDFWLELGVGYTDGQYRWKRYPVRIIDEANFNAYFDLEVNIWGTQYDPMYLATGTYYDVRVRVIDASGAFEKDYWAYLAPQSDGRLSETIGALYYDPSAPNDGDAVDWVEIAVDLDGDFQIGPGDWKLQMPIGLSATEATTSLRVMHTDAWDMRPVFTAE